MKTKSALATVEKIPTSVVEVVAEPLEVEALPSKAEFYQNIGQENAEYLQAKSRSIKDLCKDVNSKFELMGELLIATKQRVGHGNFGIFIKLELQPLYGIGEQTAEDLMRKSQFVKQYPKLNKFAPSVLTELSRVSTPQTLIQEALRLADVGENLTVAKVRSQRKEVVPKPKFVKGQFVEFLDGTQPSIGQIEAVSSKEGFTYKIKQLHGPSYKGKFPEQKLALCPVQSRQDHFDDCVKIPQAEDQVIFSPLASWNQHHAGQLFTVVASVMNGVYIKAADGIAKNQMRLLVHWAELIPATVEQQPSEPEPLEKSSVINQSNEIVVDVEAKAIEWVDEPLLTFKDLEKASDDQLSDLFSKISLEIQQRIDTSIKAELDSLVDQVWEEIKTLDQRKKEQFLVLLIDRTF